MNPKDKRTELLVGLFVFCGLALLGGLVLRFSNFRELFREKYRIYVTFEDASGLTKDAPVRLGGTRIGAVGEKPKLRGAEGGVLISLDIYSENPVAKGSTFRIKQDSLLGDAFVSVTRPEQAATAWISAGETMKGTEAGGLDDLQNAANQISEKTQRALEDIRANLKDLNVAIKKIDSDVLSDENLKHLHTTLTSIDTASTRLNEKFLSEENADSLKKSLANFATTSETLAKESARVGPLLQKGEAAINKLGPAVDSLKETSVAFRKAAESAGRTVGEIDHGDGLMTALIRDPQLKADFKNLIINLKEHGILWYKDKSASRPNQSPYERPKPPAGKR